MVLASFVLAVLIILLCLIVPGIQSVVSGCPATEGLETVLLAMGRPDFAALKSVMIAQIAALLAICVTVFVFLFTELNSRAHDYPGERIICGGLQKDFALRVERLSIQSIVLLVFNYFEGRIYDSRINDVNCGHALFALLMFASFWSSACMIWYCVDVAQYQRHLKWRAWHLTSDRFDDLAKGWRELGCTNDAQHVPTSFWAEYRAVELLLCTIVGTGEEMCGQTIEGFREVTTLGNATSNQRLIAILEAVYNYQAALTVLEDYDVKMQNNLEERHPHAMPPVKWALEKVDAILAQWNRRFRKKPEMKMGEIPGMRDGDSPNAPSIMRGIWWQIVRGSRDYYPMRSQRLHDMALTGLDFSKGTLDDATFSGCRLVRASFAGACIRGTTFSDCDLRGAKFTAVTCENLGFKSCNLGELRISDNGWLSAEDGATVLYPADCSSLAHVSFDGCLMPQSVIRGRGSDQKLDLSGVTFSGCDLSGAQFSDVLLDNSSMRGLQAIRCILSGCNGSSVNLSESRFINATMEGCELERSSVSGSLISHTMIKECKFPYLDATSAIFDKPEICDSTFVNVSFNGARILYATMKKAALMDSDVSYTNMLSSKLYDCKLKRLTGTYFSLSYAELNNVQILSAKLSYVGFVKSLMTDCTLVQSSLDNLLLREASLSHVRFDGVRMPNADCSDATFKMLHMDRVMASGAVFDRVSFLSARLADCEMDESSFAQASFYDCAFDGCSWASAMFRGAILVVCRFTTRTKEDHEALLEALLDAKVLSGVTVDGDRVGR